MKERPILFSGPMVRALLAGTKTQTRRVVKTTPELDQLLHVVTGSSGFVYVMDAAPMRPFPEVRRIRWDCPYGQPGDRLWVRESWSPDPPDVDGWGYTAWAGCREGQIAGVPERFRHPRFCNYAADWLPGPIRWTPSIHMPRWASRITLEIADVRVERLQDISEADAEAEGIDFLRSIPDADETLTAKQLYECLWESINGPGSWAANPWVWVLEFKPVATTS